MNISTKGKYAVEAMLYIAYFSGQGPLRVKVVAQALKVSEKYLEQILFLLRKKQLVETVRGAKGGYLIAKSSRDISIGDIIRSVEKDFIPVPCINGEKACTYGIRESCSTRKLWARLGKVLDNTVDNMNLEDLIQEYRLKLIKHYGEVDYYL